MFTILTLAADNLQEVLSHAGVSVDIPEGKPARITADMDWTMEAIMNMLKNCMEHTPAGGVIHCSYEQNPLYTQIIIRDEGEGFAKEDLPHLFERFFRGQNAKGGGIGIGLSLAKEIIESQNGTIHAKNNPDSEPVLKSVFTVTEMSLSFVIINHSLSGLPAQEGVTNITGRK